MSAPSQRRHLAVHAFTLMVFLAASAAPTPLYRLYQATWHFTPTMLTVIFAVYAFALLASLLFAGRLSDHLGRRPVIAVAIVLDILAMLAFMVADGPSWLVVARLLQGIATGMAMSTLGAALLDVDRHAGATVNSVGPMIGLAAGALGSTTLVVMAPAPMQGVYLVLSVLLVLSAALTFTTPETAARKAGALASLRPNVAVPAQARGALMAVSPLNLALWMLCGFYLSLMPSLVARATHSTSPWLGGVTVAIFTFSAALGVVAAMRFNALQALRRGAWLVLAGLCMVLMGVTTGHASWLVAGSIIGGGGLGAAFLGAVRGVMPLAEPHERSRLMAVFYIESYLAFSLPTIAVGAIAQRYGLVAATEVYAGVIMLLAFAGLAWIAARAHHVRAPLPG